jgi:hypothetical protein
LEHQAVGVGERTSGFPDRPLSGTKERSDRFNAGWVDRLYGAAFSGVAEEYPPLRIFAALLDRFFRTGIPTIVYIVPANIEYMRSLGMVDERGLADTIETIATLVNERGGTLVNLYDLLPDEAFRDASGHFTHEGPYDGPNMVAARLLPVVLQNALRQPDDVDTNRR